MLRLHLTMDAQPRETSQLTCLAVHAQIPRLVAGIGDGQIAVYHVYRAHGQRTPQMHQTQGFDASRKCGDVATAAYVPTGPLEQEGLLNAEVVLAGFESGRVAIFRLLLPEALGGGRPGGKVRRDEDLAAALAEAAEGGGAHRASRPVLTSNEPLLLEHYHCKSPVQSVRWHPILGILSVSTDGCVLMAATTGSIACSISAAAGRDSMVTAADFSAEHEQLAVASQRRIHLWQCFSQAKMGVLTPSSQGLKKSTTLALLVRYLPSQRFLLSAHELQGEVRVWDVLRLELVHSAVTPDCPRATCAAWDPASMMLRVFCPAGVAERRLLVHKLNRLEVVEEERRTEQDTIAVQGPLAKSPRPMSPQRRRASCIKRRSVEEGCQ